MVPKLWNPGLDNIKDFNSILIEVFKDSPLWTSWINEALLKLYDWKESNISVCNLSNLSQFSRVWGESNVAGIWSICACGTSSVSANLLWSSRDLKCLLPMFFLSNIQCFHLHFREKEKERNDEAMAALLSYISFRIATRNPVCSDLGPMYETTSRAPQSIHPRPRYFIRFWL